MSKNDSPVTCSISRKSSGVLFETFLYIYIELFFNAYGLLITQLLKLPHLRAVVRALLHGTFSGSQTTLARWTSHKLENRKLNITKYYLC